MAVFNCIGEKTDRIVTADSPFEASEKCRELYDFIPVSVIPLAKGSDDPEA